MRPTRNKIIGFVLLMVGGYFLIGEIGTIRMLAEPLPLPVLLRANLWLLVKDLGIILLSLWLFLWLILKKTLQKPEEELIQSLQELQNRDLLTEDLKVERERKDPLREIKNALNALLSFIQKDLREAYKRLKELTQRLKESEEKREKISSFLGKFGENVEEVRKELQKILEVFARLSSPRSQSRGSELWLGLREEIEKIKDSVAGLRESLSGVKEKLSSFSKIMEDYLSNLSSPLLGLEKEIKETEDTLERVRRLYHRTGEAISLLAVNLSIEASRREESGLVPISRETRSLSKDMEKGSELLEEMEKKLEEFKKIQQKAREWKKFPLWLNKMKELNSYLEGEEKRFESLPLISLENIQQMDEYFIELKAWLERAGETLSYLKSLSRRMEEWRGKVKELLSLEKEEGKI